MNFIEQAKTNGMRKLSDLDLANLISKRIFEICDLTELSLDSLAIFTGVSYSTLRSISKASLSISLDSFARICSPFNISLSDFFDPQKVLSIDCKKLEELNLFKMASSPLRNQKRDVVRPIRLTKGTNAIYKQERDFLAQMIYTTEYFSTARTLDQITADFGAMHQIVISPERLRIMLKKYVGQEILEKKAIPRKERKPTDQSRPYFYFKK